MALPGIKSSKRALMKLIRDVHVSIKTIYLKSKNYSLDTSITLKPRLTSTFTHRTEDIVQKEMGQSWCYVFEGSGDFSVSVFVRPRKDSMSSFQAIPVTSWGRHYFAVTLPDFPSIQIVNDVARNRVSITFKFHGRGSYKLAYNKTTYTNNMMLHIDLDRRRTFSIHQCNQLEKLHNGSMTGTSIVGQQPIGVISGNCHAITITSNCLKQNITKRGITGDIVTEMLMPVEAYGLEFVMFSLKERYPAGYLIIVSSENSTVVRISMGGKVPVKKLLLQHAGDVNADVATDDNRLISSNKKIQVVYVARSTCWLDRAYELLGDASMSILLPNNLFYYEYFWITPKITPDSYITLVSEADKLQYLEFDLKAFPVTADWKAVVGSETYRVRTHQVSPGNHSVASTHYFGFGCYITGLTFQSQFMHPSGFNESCNPTPDTMIADDAIDNDCDGSVDEETVNHLDDDDDEKIDEDTFLTHGTNRTPIHGGWGEWEPWDCSATCEVTFSFRERTCSDPHPSNGGLPCEGKEVETSGTICKQRESCFQECKKFTWGPNCENTCPNCADACDGRSGSCTACRKGFKNSLGGCNEKCGTNEYGADCRQKCSVKCGDDCVNRVTGECPSLINKYLMYIPFLLLVPLVGLFMFKRTRPKPQEEDVSMSDESRKSVVKFNLKPETIL